jgi:hypothetical protein
MAITYRMKKRPDGSEDPDNIEQMESRGDKTPIARGKSPFSTPFYDDQQDIQDFKNNADKVLRPKKKPKKGTA